MTWPGAVLFKGIGGGPVCKQANRLSGNDTFNFFVVVIFFLNVPVWDLNSQP